MSEKFEWKTKAKEAPLGTQGYKVLLVDDDVDLLERTHKMLAQFVFRGSGIQVVTATSGREALQLLDKNHDFALAIVDVVMETPKAGLELVKSMREKQANLSTRVILRTGHPSDFPESRVVIDYDINDYLDKSQTDKQRIYIAVTLALRSFDELKAISDKRKELAAYEARLKSDYAGLRSFIFNAIQHARPESHDVLKKSISFVISGEIDEARAKLMFNRDFNSHNISSEIEIAGPFYRDRMSDRGLSSSKERKSAQVLEIIASLKIGKYDDFRKTVTSLRHALGGLKGKESHYFAMLPYDLQIQVQEMSERVRREDWWLTVPYLTDELDASLDDENFAKAVSKVKEICKNETLDFEHLVATRSPEIQLRIKNALGKI